MNEWITLKNGTMIHKSWKDIAYFDINSELWDKETSDFIEEFRNFCNRYDEFKIFMREDYAKVGFNMPYGVIGQFIQDRKNDRNKNQEV